VIGNPYPCNNFFYLGTKKGDEPRAEGQPPNYNLYRKVIQIKATDSPNVRLALQEKAEGKEPSHKTVIPGVLSYAKYLERREKWDEVRQSVGLDATFYEGAQVLMFPPTWLNRTEEVARILRGRGKRKGRTMGCDPAEGGDSSTWAISDEWGLIHLESLKTPDTSFIPKHTIALAQEYGVDAEDVLFDAGGGGKQHADHLADIGFNCRIVAFGESASDVNRFRFRTREERQDEVETKFVYVNRRAQMYHLIRLMIDPSYPYNGIAKDGGPMVWGIPEEYTELRRQLAPIPLLYDPEGKIRLLPKNKRSSDSKEQTLVELLGCSPDEADAVSLSVFGLWCEPEIIVLKGLVA
jgi:hypothetical protein